MFNWAAEIKYFDRVFTFDPKDAKSYNLEYKPNFFVRHPDQEIASENFDLFFAGKFTPFRLSVVDILIELAIRNRLKYFIKIWPAYKIFPHNRLVYKFIKKISLNSGWTKKYLLNFETLEGILKRDFFITNKVDHGEIQNSLLSSNVILDLPFQGQTGYTHILIEALANGKKLITTNTEIKKERFYNPDQIHILDKHCIEADPEWMSEKMTFKIDSYFNDLELSSWIKSIINVETV